MSRGCGPGVCVCSGDRHGGDRLCGLMGCAGPPDPRTQCPSQLLPGSGGGGEGAGSSRGRGEGVQCGRSNGRHPWMPCGRMRLPGPGARCGGSSSLWLQVQGSRRKANCPRSRGFYSPDPCPSGNPSDSSSGSLPAVASLSPAWPDQPDQLLPTERTTHATPPGVTTSAGAVPTVRPPSPVPVRASRPTLGARPPRPALSCVGPDQVTSGAPGSPSQAGVRPAPGVTGCSAGRPWVLRRWGFRGHRQLITTA